MPRKTSQPLPAVQRALRELGENIRLARRRRRFTATLVAERAGMSRPTLRAIERGEPGVTLGALANVLHSLGAEKELLRLARDHRQEVSTETKAVKQGWKRTSRATRHAAVGGPPVRA